MKKLSILILSIVIFTSLSAQDQIKRDHVVLEIVTGTWCYYCPGAAMGADQLVANGDTVAVIEYHSGDTYATGESNFRKNYYAVGGIPTAYFDGTLSVVGGSHTSSMYNSYLPKVNTRMGVPTSFDIHLSLNYLGNDLYEAKIFFTKVAPSAENEFKAHLVLTESGISEFWQGHEGLNFVMRKMYPDQYGIDVNFDSLDVQVVSHTFTKNAAWDSAGVELVAFLQNNNSKEIMNGTKKKLHELALPVFADMHPLDSVITAGEAIQFEDSSFGDVAARYWYFPGGTPEISNSKNPQITYNTAGVYDVKLVVTNGFYQDSVILEEFVTINIDSTKAELISVSLPEAIADSTIIDTANRNIDFLVVPGTNITNLAPEFTISDGATIDPASGSTQDLSAPVSYTITSANGISTQTWTVSARVAIGIEHLFLSDLKIYPIPARNLIHVSLNMKNDENMSVGIYNSVGELVQLYNGNQLKSGNNNLSLDVSTLSNGFYFMKFNFQNFSLQRKIMIIK